MNPKFAHEYKINKRMEKVAAGRCLCKCGNVAFKVRHGDTICRRCYRIERNMCRTKPKVGTGRDSVIDVVRYEVCLPIGGE
jgi:hypothetical protein